MKDRHPLLSAAYFAPVQWFFHLNRGESAWIDRHEHFIKQTFRNRCIIASPQGALALSVPVEAPSGGSLSHTPMSDVRISNHGKWRTEHWNALKTAYGESPFFEYYADDIRPFFERQWTFLFDFNFEITQKLCELLDIRPHMELTDRYIPAEKTAAEGRSDPSTDRLQPTDEPQKTVSLQDFRAAIRPKNPPADPDFTPRPYYQVYRTEHGFLPNLSVLDLLFNMGNEAILWL